MCMHPGPKVWKTYVHPSADLLLMIQVSIGGALLAN